MMRRRSSPSIPKPFICISWLTPPVLNASKANPLLGVSQDKHLNDLGTEFFAPLRIISVKIVRYPIARETLHSRITGPQTMSEPLYFFKTIPGLFQPFAVALVLALLGAEVAGLYHLGRKNWARGLGLMLGGILLVFAFGQNIVKARSASTYHHCKGNLKSIADALSLYRADWDEKYPASEDQLVPKYLKSIPVCPETGEPTYKFELQPKSFLVYCRSHNHQGAGIPANYPQFSTAEGLVEP